MGVFLFLDRDGAYHVPGDLRQELLDLVPKPAPATVQVCEALPQQCHGHLLAVRTCEGEALTDLAIVLRLADQGRLPGSDKMSPPGTSTMRLLADTLTGGNFYLTKQSGPSDQAAEPAGAIWRTCRLVARDPTTAAAVRGPSRSCPSSAATTAFATPASLCWAPTA